MLRRRQRQRWQWRRCLWQWQYQLKRKRKIWLTVIFFGKEGNFRQSTRTHNKIKFFRFFFGLPQVNFPSFRVTWFTLLNIIIAILDVYCHSTFYSTSGLIPSLFGIIQSQYLSVCLFVFRFSSHVAQIPNKLLLTTKRGDYSTPIAITSANNLLLFFIHLSMFLSLRPPPF